MKEQSPFTHILVPTDGSESSIKAGRLAIQIAVTHDTPLTFVYVVDSIAAENMARSTGHALEDVYRELEIKGQRYLEYLPSLARNRGLQTHQVIRRGIPHREIAQLARERHVDLIVMGHIVRRGALRLHGSSLSERLVENDATPCPVLIVRHVLSRR
jgi:nucleotide-binding universal stress UspA family protein